MKFLVGEDQLDKSSCPARSRYHTACLDFLHAFVQYYVHGEVNMIVLVITEKYDGLRKNSFQAPTCCALALPRAPSLLPLCSLVLVHCSFATPFCSLGAPTKAALLPFSLSRPAMAIEIPKFGCI